MKIFTQRLYLLSLLALSISAQGSITVGGTRLIFDGSKKETSLSVENKDNVANLVQSWIVPTDSAPKDAIIVTPPLFRLNAGGKNILRFVCSGIPLPENRESMYWLNIKGIAAANDEQQFQNMVQIAVNTRIKLIYRPASLQGTIPEDATHLITWKVIDGTKLSVSNPTNYYMNFAVIKFNGINIDDATYVAPGETATFNISNSKATGEITWRIYNDFGMGGPEHHAKI